MPNSQPRAAGSPREQNKGFTILEIIIVVLFVAVALVSIIEVFNMDFGASDASRQRLLAAAQAQKLMEEVSYLTYSERAARGWGSDVELKDTGSSQLVTVNIPWETVKSAGRVTLAREFFYIENMAGGGGGKTVKPPKG